MLYYVSLDLGSESMASYYENSDSGDGGLIDLQQHGKILSGSGIVYLLENDGQRSKRLRTRIFLEKLRQPKVLIDDHARLEFTDGTTELDGYKKSIFRYFYTEGQEFVGQIMPNPKIPFQNGGNEIIPPVETTTHAEYVKHSPEILIQHLTTQVVNNFILRSQELKDIGKDQINLILTLPNVYSITHVESIRKYLQRILKINNIECIYESDAVAYFALAQINENNDPEYLKNFKRKFEEKLKKLANETKKNKNFEYLIETIDIGRGTTDLSLIQISGPKGGENTRKHTVLARNGKSTGGNILSYIFAEYYNDCFNNLLDFFKIKNEFHWDFLTKTNEAVKDILQKLIEEVKMNFTKDFKLSLGEEEQKKLLSSLAEKISFDEKIDNGIREKFKNKFIDTLVLPKNLYSFIDIIINRIKNDFPYLFNKNNEIKFNDEIKSLQINLIKKIKKYVKENVKTLHDDLIELALSRENLPKRNPSSINTLKNEYQKKITAIVIAGQASQFQPIRNAISNLFSGSRKNILFLETNLAKESCCRGAVIFKNACNEFVNPDEIHGSYGFLSPVVTNSDDRFRSVDMKKIKDGKSDVIKFHAKANYSLIYCSRLLNEGKRPTIGDGYTARIRQIQGNVFKFQYNHSSKHIVVNDNEISGVSTFGDVQESIYPKVWPEITKD